MSRHRKQVRLTQTLVDIVLVVHRRIDLLTETLNAIPAAFPDVKYKIIIFDNATPAGEKRQLYAQLKREPDIYTIYENAENVGFPRGCNRGAKMGYSPILFFLNSDCVLAPNSGEHLVRALDEPHVGVVGMKLIFPPDAKDLRADIRPALKLQHICLATNIRGEVFHPLVGWNPDSERVNRVRKVLGVTGAALMTRRNIFKDTGGFYEGYGTGCFEDIDYCMQVWAKKYDVIVEPKAEGYHYVGATAESYKIPYALNQNKLLFLQRWGNSLPWSEWETW